MSFLGLRAASRITGRSEEDLIALALAGRIGVWHDSGGAPYFDQAEIVGFSEPEAPQPGEDLWEVVGNEERERRGSVWQATSWRYVDHQAEKLGSPEVWAEVESAALEQAWADLMSGSYAERVRARLPKRELPTKAERDKALRNAATAVQSPLVAVAKEERKQGRPRSRAWELREQIVAMHEASIPVPEQAAALGVSEYTVWRLRRAAGLRWASKSTRRVS